MKVWKTENLSVLRTQDFENSILWQKLFWPSVRKNCSSDWEKLLKFEAEGSLEQFIQTMKGQNNFR